MQESLSLPIASTPFGSFRSGFDKQSVLHDTRFQVSFYQFCHPFVMDVLSQQIHQQFVIQRVDLLPSFTGDLRLFGPSRKFFSSSGTMTSADFSQFVVTTQFFPTPVRRVLTYSFPLYLPHLPLTTPCSYWALFCYANLPSLAALYAISVRQARVLPPSFFRFRLTTDTLDLSYILPATG